MKINKIYSNVFNDEIQNIPKEFVIWLEKGESLEPWKTFENNELSLVRFSSLIIEKYSDSLLLPFSFIHDLSGFYNDSWPVVAYFDLKAEAIIRIYDFALPDNTPWMNLSYESFSDWLAMAREESKEYKDEMLEFQHLDDEA